MARNATKQDEQIVAKTKRETLFRLFRYLLGYKKTYPRRKDRSYRPLRCKEGRGGVLRGYR